MNTIQLHDNWMTRARCADTDPAHFFPSDGVGVELAKKTCAGCPVTEQCLEYALTNRVEHGVWGGCRPSKPSASSRDILSCKSS